MTSVVFPGKWTLRWMFLGSKVLEKCSHNQQLWKSKGNRNGYKEGLNCILIATKDLANSTGLSRAGMVLRSYTT